MGVGPLVAAAGLALMTTVDADVSYFTDLLPPLLVFSLGLSMTVAPLTATVLAAADEGNAGTASGINNAIARTAGLLGIALVGALVAGPLRRTRPTRPWPRSTSPWSSRRCWWRWAAWPR